MKACTSIPAMARQGMKQVVTYNHTNIPVAKILVNDRDIFIKSQNYIGKGFCVAHRDLPNHKQIFYYIKY